MNILIAEDQDTVREVMVEAIRAMEPCAHLEQAASLAEARDKMAGRDWDGVVTDYNLGDGKSLELIEELKRRGELPPVVLVSGYLSPSRMEKAQALGVAHILPKPFDPEALQACLRDVLGQCHNDDAGATPDMSSRELRHGTLLPRVLDLGRTQGLMFRIVNDLGRYHDVERICSSALGIAMDIVHADRGFVCLFDRAANRLIRITHRDDDERDAGMAEAPSASSLADTPFSPLLLWGEEYLDGPPREGGHACWPGVTADNFLAIQLRLQGVAMGVLCVMGRMDAEAGVSEQDRNLLAMLINQLDTLLDNRAVHASLAASMKETLIALVRSLEARDRYTKDHSLRVGDLSALFARRLGLDEDHVELIRTGGRLHDIGKCGIPDAVLLKPGRYTDREFAIMKAHPGIGDAILRHMDALVRERQMVRHHHERMDGNGYPDRLKGEAIPLEARIVCVADAIDAMTTHRVYRMARPLSFCVEQLKRNSGTQFDSRVVEVALEAIELGEIKTQARDAGEDAGLMPLSARAA